MKVATRLAAGSALAMGILGGVVAHQLVLVQRLAETARQLSRNSLRAASLSIEQINDLDAAERLLRKYYITGDAGYAERAAQAAKTIGDGRRALIPLDLDPSEREALGKADAIWARSALARAAREGPSAFDLGPGAEQPLLSEIVRLQAAFQRQAQAMEDAVRLRASAAETAALRARMISVLGAAGAIVMGSIVLALNVRSIRAPLRRLTRATHAVTEGRFDLEIKPSGGDEFRHLAEDFNAMVGRLSELDRMKRDLLSNVSHELKGPLASVQEATNLLLEEIPGPLTGSQRKLLEMSRSSASRLSAMIVKLLDLALLESGTVTYDIQEHDVGNLTEAAVAEMRTRAFERGVALRFAHRMEPVLAPLDGVRFQEVLSNLLENAVMFSPAGSEVVLSVERTRRLPPGAPAGTSVTGERLLVSVADRGPGIPDSEKAAIFDRFHRAKRSIHVHDRGIGLGLAICREIMAALGGQIWVEDHPEGGSIFRVLLALETSGGQRREGTP